MYFVFIMFLTHSATVEAEDALSYGNLQCFNDYDKSMVCHLTSDKSHCSGYNLQLDLDDPHYRDTYFCTFEETESPGGVSKCSCSIGNISLVLGEKFKATLSHSGKHVNFEISIKDSIKPKAPTIEEVNLTENKDFWVKWKTNYEKSFSFNHLIAELSYKKKGQTDEFSVNITSTSHEILGRDLEPNIVYALKIRTYTDISNRFSDWSKEFEFKKPASSSGLLIFLIILFCIAVVLIASGLFWCSVRLKTKWWDKILKPEIGHPWVPAAPNGLDLLKEYFSPIYVDTSEVDQTEGKPWTKPFVVDGNSGECLQDSSSEDPSSTDYADIVPVSPESSNVSIIRHFEEALEQVFPNLENSFRDSKKPFVREPLGNCPESNGEGSAGYKRVKVTNASGGSFVYNNKTYSPSETFPFSTQPCHDLPRRAPPAFLGTGQPNQPTSGAPVMLTDFPYKMCDGSGGDPESTTSAEHTGRTFGSDDNAAALTPHSRISVVSTCQRFDQAAGKDRELANDAAVTVPLLVESFQNVDSSLIYDMNPCYQSLPDRGCNLAPSDDSYQALQNLGTNGLEAMVAGQSVEQDRHFDGSLSEISHTSAENSPPDFLFQAGSPILGSPFLTAFGTDQATPMACDSTYHCL